MQTKKVSEPTFLHQIKRCFGILFGLNAQVFMSFIFEINTNLNVPVNTNIGRGPIAMGVMIRVMVSNATFNNCCKLLDNLFNNICNPFVRPLSAITKHIRTKKVSEPTFLHQIKRCFGILFGLNAQVFMTFIFE
jgi:tetrahydromethanopterin S-methyltransferase subunit G